MFKEGNFVIFNGYGVCEVTDVGGLDIEGISKDKLYYTLRPIYTKGSIVQTPVDNQKEIMRAVLTKDEAEQLIDEIKSIDYLWVNDERKREREYRDVMKSCDCRALIKIIKAIYIRQKKRIEHGKAMTSIDKRYFELAEDCLYGELAVSLGMTKEDAQQYVSDRLSKIHVDEN